MTSPRPHPRASLVWIAPDLAEIHDEVIIAALLDRAGGVEPGHQRLTNRQFEALSEHRLLSLVPRSWTVASEGDIKTLQQALVAQQLAMTAEAGLVIAAMSSSRIDHRVLKGAASCFLDYADPSLRTFGDVDILVQLQDFDRTLTLLHEEFGATTFDPGRYGYRFDIEATMTMPSGAEIDIHHRLSPFALDAPELFNDGQAVAELDAVALSTEWRLCHAALHVLATPPGTRRLSGLADVAAIRATNEIDLDLVRSNAAKLGTEALVGTALAIERSARNLPVDTDHWAGFTFLEHHTFARASRHMVAEQVHRMRQIEGMGSRARFVLSRMLPNQSQIEKRGGIADYFGRLLPDRSRR